MDEIQEVSGGSVQKKPEVSIAVAGNGMYPVFFMHSSVDGHSGFFLFLAFVSSAAVNSGVE